MLTGIRNVSVFVGTDEIIYPDATKMFGMLDRDVSNELIVGEGMNHVYPLFPIKEAVNGDHSYFLLTTASTTPPLMPIFTLSATLRMTLRS